MADWEDEFCGDCGYPYRECMCGGAARREVRHLRGLLARLEWAGSTHIEESACPECGAPQPDDWKPTSQHDPDCLLAAALRRDPPG